MARRQLNPGDPEVVERVVQLIRETSREELLQRLRAMPDWDESWLHEPEHPDGVSVKIARGSPVRVRRPAVKRP
jgi:hypothetical protein